MMIVDHNWVFGMYVGTFGLCHLFGIVSILGSGVVFLWSIVSRMRKRPPIVDAAPIVDAVSV